MFRGLQKTVLRRRKFYESKGKATDEISKLVTEFLKINYSEQTLKNTGFNLNYDPQQGKLLIQTKSKIFANDLILKLDSLRGLVEKRGQKLKEIVVR